MERVVPFVEDRRNALVLHLLEGGDAQLLASVQVAELQAPTLAEP